MIRLFLDTDIGPDCDDAGALQLIHTLCDSGEADLLGVTHCTGSPYGLPAISAINRVNGREVPLGTSPRRDFLSGENCLRYTRPVAERFDHAYRRGEPQRLALPVFREVLLAQPDGSVTLCAIGPLNNLAEYLAACPELIGQKVRLLVMMAGRFDQEEPEWNVAQDIPAARSVIENWPTPAVLCGWECGAGVLSGQSLSRYDRHPVKEAYRLYCGEGMARDSWDLLTALFAVRGEGDLLGAGAPGFVRVDDSGVTRFAEDPAGNRRYVINRAEKTAIAAALNELL